MWNVNSVTIPPDARESCNDAVVSNFLKLFAAGPTFFVSAWILMLFAGALRTDVGIRPFGYVTAMVATIALWLAVVPAISAVAGSQRMKSKQ